MNAIYKLKLTTAYNMLTVEHVLYSRVKLSTTQIWIRDWSKGVDGVASHHHEFYNIIIFSQNNFQVQPEEDEFSNFSGVKPPDPLTRAFFTY